MADMLTTNEAAQRLGVSVRAIQQLITRERLPAEKRGRDYFISEEVIRSFLASKSKRGRPPKKLN